MLSRFGIDRFVRIMSLRQTRSASKSSAPSNPMPPPPANVARKRKAAAPAERADEDGPRTPKRKARAAPVLTPTPSAVNAIAHTGASLPTTPKSKKPRRADPKATNAPLQTPGGSKILKTYPSDLFENASPTKGGGFTTDNLLKRACAHLCAVDTYAKLQPLIERHTCKMFTPEGLAENVDPFEALVSSIISQQVRTGAMHEHNQANESPSRYLVRQQLLLKESSYLCSPSHPPNLPKTSSQLLKRLPRLHLSFSAQLVCHSEKQSTFKAWQRSLPAGNCLCAC